MIRTDQFVDFTDGVQAAELSGYWVDLCRQQLERLERLPSIEEERSLYKSGAAFHLLTEAMTIGVDIVLVSQTGALALKGSEETDWSVPFQLAKTLDKGNYIQTISPKFVDNSELVFSQAPSPLDIDSIVADFSIPDTLDGIE